MSIRYKSGDVTEADEKLIAHGCNNVGVMGEGVALAVRDKWPEVYDFYHEACRIGSPLGDVIFVNTRDGKTIANAITQATVGLTGKHVSYDAIHDCFKEINAFCIGANINRIAIPRIGSGLGGGEWDVIAKIIEAVCLHVEVVVYDL